MSSNGSLENGKRASVATERNYLVSSVAEAKSIVSERLAELELSQTTTLGLPEVDDRYHIWRVPICDLQKIRIGEIIIDAYTTSIDFQRSTKPEMLESRLLRKSEAQSVSKVPQLSEYHQITLRNTVGMGDCLNLLEEMPASSVDLIFTSPPYFNARPEYSDYEEYEQYLFFIKQVISRAKRVLKDGRFFVMNVSPVLLRRASRSQSSTRLAVPFDMHALFISCGFEFIDDIIWVKPEGAGWATGRGRRFAADRNPLQYKAVPVTEYVLVYRKSSEKLIDWHIRNHPNQDIVAESKIMNGYEKTNIWRIQPATGSKHPAAFPLELAEKVISYYSFKHDVVLDPFAGSGTVGAAAAKLERKFVLFEKNPDYIKLIQEGVPTWLGRSTDDVLWLNCTAPETTQFFLPTGDPDGV